MKRFKLKDADDIGFANYPTANRTYDGDAIVKAQERLCNDGFITDTDGCVGQGTLTAIQQWESLKGIDFFTGEKLVSTVAYPSTKIIQGFPHICQGHYPDLMIVPAPGGDGIAKPVKNIGCASCMVHMHECFYFDKNPDMHIFIAKMIDAEAYDHKRDIRWGVVQEVFGMVHHRDIGYEAACEHANDGDIVTCVEKTDWGVHFTAGIGRANGRWAVNNPGRQQGCYYDHPESNLKPDDIMVRYDLLLPL